jgi:hypothetical protein
MLVGLRPEYVSSDKKNLLTLEKTLSAGDQ